MVVLHNIFVVTVLFCGFFHLQLKANVVSVNLTSVGLNYAVAMNVSSGGGITTSVNSLLYSINNYFYYYNSSVIM